MKILFIPPPHRFPLKKKSFYKLPKIELIYVLRKACPDKSESCKELNCQLDTAPVTTFTNSTTAERLSDAAFGAEAPQEPLPQSGAVKAPDRISDSRVEDARGDAQPHTAAGAGAIISFSLLDKNI